MGSSAPPHRKASVRALEIAQMLAIAQMLEVAQMLEIQRDPARRLGP
jgi:hypothetical protein